MSRCDRTAAAIDKAIANMGPDKAAANEKCRTDPRFGTGYHADNFKRDGSFSCVPNQATANAWCEQHNQGTGWFAKGIRRDGSFNCDRSAAAERADAEADCRRQHGDRLIRVFKSGNQWRCEYKSDRMVAEENCRRQFGNRLIRVFRQGGQWRCEYRTGTAQGNTRRCPPGFTLLNNGTCVDLRGIGSALEGISKALGSGNGRGRSQSRECPEGYNPYGCN
jgi:hypothetical protein